jgi:hypothetical protein
MPFIKTLLNLLSFMDQTVVRCAVLTAVPFKNSLLGCHATYGKILLIQYPWDQPDAGLSTISDYGAIPILN